MQIIQDRRALHRIPELALCLPKTMDYLRASLEGLGCTLFSPVESSLCAYFDFGAEKTIAFRADCDALPIREGADHQYVSTHPGNMHACGHDGHMAILLELARRLSAKEKLCKNVLLIFQPGEETPGGALSICKTGVLETYGVEAIFGLHLWPGLQKGEMFCREEEMMSHASEITVEIFGKSAHLAKSEDGIDAMAAAVELHRLVAEAEASLPAQVYRLMKFGKMYSGSVRNAVSDHSRLEGSLRAFQDDVFDCLKDRLYAIGKEVEAKFGCRVQIHMTEGYPAVMNSPALCQKIWEHLPVNRLDKPSMTAEDFSWYQRYVPGVFFFLGLGDVPALHSDVFDFDDTVLKKGADFFENLVENVACYL